MEAIKDTINKLILSWGNKKKHAHGDNAEVLLKKIFTKKELEHIRLNYFKKGTLSIRVDSSSWLYQLGLKKEGLLAKLRRQSNVIEDIRFCLGEMNG